MKEREAAARPLRRTLIPARTPRREQTCAVPPAHLYAEPERGRHPGRQIQGLSRIPHQELPRPLRRGGNRGGVQRQDRADQKYSEYSFT